MGRLSLIEAIGRAGSCFVASGCGVFVVQSFGGSTDLAFTVGLGLGLGAIYAYSRWVYRWGSRSPS